jgi:peptidoglycan/LPS O-acetylase OafA/YrhL
MKRLEWANALRGVAAITVLAAHYCGFWFNHAGAAYLARRDPVLMDPAGSTPGLAHWLLATPVHLGAFGVALFFLISGYVISISLDHYSRTGFLVARTLRLLPTYAACYLVICAAIWAASDPRGELSAQTVLIGMVPGLSNLLRVRVPPDGVVWTLRIEIVFYIVALIFHRRLASCWKTIALIAALCVAAQLLIPPKQWGVKSIVLFATPFLPVMLIGVVLASCRQRIFTPPQTALLIAGLTITHAALLHIWTYTPFQLDYKLTFLGTIALFIGIWWFGDGWRPNAIASFLAAISYPLYVLHVVLGYTLLTLLTRQGVGGTSAFLITTAAAILAAYAVHRLLETPTHQLARTWARRLGAPRRREVEGKAEALAATAS